MENLNDIDEKGMEVVMRGPKLDKMVASPEEIAAILLFLHKTKHLTLTDKFCFQMVDLLICKSFLKFLQAQAIL